MSFVRPLFLVLGVLVLLAIIVFTRIFHDVTKLNIPLGAPGGVAFKAPVNFDVLIRILTILDYFALVLLFIASAWPVTITSTSIYLNRGMDMLFLLDSSPSMASLDMNGQTRFDAAQELILDFSSKRPNDAIGLAAVGLDAALLLPPTTDRSSLAYQLKNLSLGALGDGTALGTGLSTASLHLKNSPAPRRSIVLLTDGENNAGTINPLTAARLINEQGIALWIIGLGSGGEVPIDYIDPISRVRRTGIFDSRFNAEALRELAAAGGGTYLSASSKEALSEAFFQINDTEFIPVKTATIKTSHSLADPFIAIAAALIIIVRFIRLHVLGALL
ncbi:hypothetical protein FACS1894200_04230 [Spirochaetia bacterium]|nr:hypothetical protein FACS1894200_04230 [Spirochaetia bacterium]